jgi:hypothetical protein
MSSFAEKLAMALEAYPHSQSKLDLRNVAYLHKNSPNDSTLHVVLSGQDAPLVVNGEEADALEKAYDRYANYQSKGLAGGLIVRLIKETLQKEMEAAREQILTSTSKLNSEK